MREHKILVVDDEAANARLLQRVLGDDHLVFTALDAVQGLAVLKEQDISLIISHQHMSDFRGRQLLEQGKTYQFIPKPWDADELKLTVRQALEAYELKENNNLLLIELQKSMAQLEEFSMGTIRALTNALNAKCDYTSGHSLRVGHYALALGKALTLSAAELKDIELAGILHDIGKIGIPESILWKPEVLNSDERSIMSSHPLKGAQIIGELQGFGRMRQYVLHHHEFIDGSGYPDGLAGDNIPLGARIILVADAYDAMTSDRPYRKSIGHERAMGELRKHAGQQFDSSIVETLPVALGQNGELAQSCLPENITGLSFSAINPGQMARFHQG